MTPSDVFKDPEFRALPQSEQSKILQQIDPDFKRLLPEDQAKVLQSVSSHAPRVTKIDPMVKNYERYPIGATIGGIGGSVVGLPGGPGASIGLGFAGATGGDLVQSTVEKSLNLPQAPADPVKNAAKEGLISLATDLGGRVLMGGFYARQVAPDAKKAMSFLEPYLPNQQLLPAQMTENRTIDIIHNVAESSVVGGGNIKQFRLRQDQMLVEAAEDFVNQFGAKSEPDELGKLFIAATDKGKKAAQLPAKLMYDQVELLAAPTMVQKMVPQISTTGPVRQVVMAPTMVPQGGAQIDLKGAKAFAAPLAAQGKRIGGVESAKAGDDLAATMAGMPDRVTYTDAKELRSRLLSFVDQMSIDNKKAPAIGKAKQMITMLDTEIEKGLTAFDPALAAMWRDANKIYRDGSETFNNEVIRRLVKKGLEQFGNDPESIIKTIFMPGHPTRVGVVRKAVDSATWTKLQGHAANDLMARGEVNGVLTGQKLEDALTGRTGYGAKMLGEIFDPAQVENFKQLANALKVVQSKQADGTGRMLIQLTQGGALLALATSPFDSQGLDMAAGGILLGPAILSKIMTTPALARWFIQGVGTTQTAPMAASIAARLINAVVPRQVPATIPPPQASPRPPGTQVPRPFALQP